MIQPDPGTVDHSVIITKMFWRRLSPAECYELQQLRRNKSILYTKASIADDYNRSREKDALRNHFFCQ
jgi:hypothetical protein